MQTIKVLNGRLNDVKKTLQQELKVNNGNASTHTTANVPSAATNVALSDNDKLIGEMNAQPTVVMDDVNFKYLKHVILKFLTSREVRHPRTNFAQISNVSRNLGLISGRSTSPDPRHRHIIAFESRGRATSARHAKLQSQLVWHTAN